MDLFAEKLQNNILLRQKNDKPLIKYRFLVFFVLLFWVFFVFIIVTRLFLYDISAVTIYLYLFLFYMFLFTISLLRFQKVNNFIKRKQAWYYDVTAFTKEHSSHQADCNTLETLSKNTFHQIKSIPIKLYLVYHVIVLAIILSAPFSTNYHLLTSIIFFILTIIFFIFIDIPINSVWNRLQHFEYQFDQQLSTIWKKEHWIENDIDFIVDPQKDRNFILWTFFSLISFRVMGIIWDYKIHTDPDNLYPKFHKIEDDLLSHIDTIENNKDIRPVL